MKNNYIINFITFFLIYIFIITEVFSFFKIINTTSILISWFIYIIITGIFIMKKKKQILEIIKNIKLNNIFNYILDNKIFVIQVIIALYLIIKMFFIAINTVPYNWDSMTYHLSRIMNWIQNKSVDYYPTNILRQLYSPPMAEYILLHIYLIFKNDILFNLLQWFSYGFSSYLIFKICRNFKINKEISMISSIIYLTMPIVIAESITTQVDLFSSMILLLFIYYLQYFISLDKLKLNKTNIIYLFLLASLAGIGYISKRQICIVMLIFLIYLMIVRIQKKDKFKEMIKYIIIALFIILPFVLPSFYRNYKQTGDILASEYFSNISIETKNPKYIFVNILKNYGTSANSFIYPERNENRMKWILDISKKLNVDINDERITFTGDFPSNIYANYHCDLATVPEVITIFKISLIFYILYFMYSIYKKKYLNNNILLMTLLISILSNFIIVRWQPWGTRLLIPSYILMCIFVSYIIHIYENKFKKENLLGIFIILLPIILLFTSSFAIKYNYKISKDYNGDNKNQLYFRSRFEFDQYNKIIEFIKSNKYKNIGLKIDTDTYEYPLWAMLSDYDKKIYHVNNNLNENKKFDCIVSIHSDNYSLNDIIKIGKNKYKCVWIYNDQTSDYAVLEKVGLKNEK